MEQVIENAWITYKLREGFTRRFAQITTYLTMWEKLDTLLVQRAVSAGAEFIDGFKVSRIDQNDKGTRVTKEKETFAASVLVGADGANSLVSHQLGLNRGREIGVGLESEVYPEASSMDRWATTASIDYGTLRGGYMWVFPKEDHLSIGVGGFARSSPDMKQLLDRYLKHLQLGSYQQRLTRGHKIPRRKKGEPIQKGNALLVGDAAGLVDFWTGEGIYYAIRSAQTAAPVVRNFLGGEAPDLTEYERLIDRDIMPELKVARTMTRIGVMFPRLAYTLMKNSDRAWNVGCQLLRAEKSYVDAKRRLGPAAPLFDLVSIGA